MLFGELVGLRARREEDVPVLEADLYEDVAGHSRADSRPWRPLAPGTSSYRMKEPQDGVATFSVIELASEELAGDALVWGMDLHNRSGHLGLALRPSFRGRQLGSDVVRVLCHYGFSVLGLHRLQVETLVDNESMTRTALKAGFEHEGVLRQSAWVMGEFRDVAVLGLLAEDWRSEPPSSAQRS